MTTATATDKPVSTGFWLALAAALAIGTFLVGSALQPAGVALAAIAVLATVVTLVLAVFRGIGSKVAAAGATLALLGALLRLALLAG